MKPDNINAIIDTRVLNGIPYLRLLEAGEPLSSKVLTWVIKYAIFNNINLLWKINGVEHLIVSQEFLSAFETNNSVLEKNE
jgi:hypothetical protein